MTLYKFKRGMVLLILGLVLGHVLMAQQPGAKSTKPSWITMMDDPNVNYFEAVKSFEQYWKDKERPVVENEMFESAENKEKEEAIRQKKAKLKPDDPAVLYAFEYKRFLWWMREMEPFVQPDGRIKGMDERINEWKTQQQQKKEQEQKAKEKSEGKKNN